MPSCDHKGNKTFRCKNLRIVDVKEFHDNFYKTTDKATQDAFILKYIGIREPARRRSKKMDSSKKGISVNYYVKVKSAGDFKLQVCQKTFLNILLISKDRVQRIARNHLRTGEMPLEKRGGDKTSKRFLAKKTSVRNFIEGLKNCSETHYCRGKSQARQYLPGDLNISKIWRMYNNQAPVELKVRKTFFRTLFCVEYNIGFGSPVTDACSTCLSYKEQLKTLQDPGAKSKTMISLRVHKLRANAFYTKLKENADGLQTFSFDCQKNLVVPKVPDQIAYYSRQLYTYNFTIVKGSSNEKLTKDNVYIYTWNENDYRKSSNEIASAVHDCLVKTDLSNISVIRLCADGCGGQNRNSNMIFMCAHYLLNSAPANVKRIEIVFPVRGHSFLPSDRVFGLIEKDLKKMPVIYEPNTYTDVFNKYGTVSKLGEDCKVYDWKKSGTELFKKPGQWHFQFSFCKRFILSRTKSLTNVLIRGEVSYQSDMNNPGSVMKKNKRLKDAVIGEVPRGVVVKPSKISDVKQLLISHFGENWFDNPSTTYLKNVLNTYGHGVAATGASIDEDEEYDCCQGEEGVDLIV